MKAVGYRKSLPIEATDALIDFEAAKPEPRGRDLRVAVKAVSANPVDYKVRKRAGPPEGETKILGYDAAGIVDAVGPDVTLFKPGEEVLVYRDVGELKRRLDDCLARPDEARAIGANARRRALAEHTLRHRIDEMLTVIQDRFGLKARPAGRHARRRDGSGS